MDQTSKPCGGQNSNVCAAEGCFGESCVTVTRRPTLERSRHVERRTICDKCGQHQGLFHKGCDGEWVEQARFVTDWQWA